jgi:hypothetical protein
MSELKGKYYWVRTPAGKEVAFKRNSGKWELCGINNDEDCKDVILEVYGEVANGVNASDSGLHLQRVTHRFITSIAEQYGIEPSKIVIGSQYGTLVVQKYDEGAADKWETLALIDPNGG